MKVYIVWGESGEYDSYSHWDVKAFLSEDKALLFKAQVEKENNKLYKKAGFEKSRFNYPEFKKNKYDPFAKFDFTGTTYHVKSLNLDGSE